ncbi:MAG: hypothetical protein RQ751_12520, partial [Longimicrobiales bacterium]|nr:hypothetical protein [Longimicrobiales bacterium]
EAAGTVSPGDAVTLRTDRGDVPGRVRNVSPALDPRTRRFTVEILPEPGVGQAAAGTAGSGSAAPAATLLVPGAFVRVEYAGAGDAARWIPADAVVRRGQLTGVFTVEADTLRLRWIRLGREREDAVEILSGPPGTLTVVRAPEAALRDGQPVASVEVRAP